MMARKPRSTLNGFGITIRRSNHQEGGFRDETIFGPEDLRRASDSAPDRPRRSVCKPVITWLGAIRASLRSMDSGSLPAAAGHAPRQLWRPNDLAKGGRMHPTPSPQGFEDASANWKIWLESSLISGEEINGIIRCRLYGGSNVFVCGGLAGKIIFNDDRTANASLTVSDWLLGKQMEIAWSIDRSLASHCILKVPKGEYLARVGSVYHIYSSYRR